MTEHAREILSLGHLARAVIEHGSGAGPVQLHTGAIVDHGLKLSQTLHLRGLIIMACTAAVRWLLDEVDNPRSCLRFS